MGKRQRQEDADVRALRRCWECYGSLGGRHSVEYSPNRVFARHADLGVCLDVAIARLASLSRPNTRRANRRQRKQRRKKGA